MTENCKFRKAILSAFLQHFATKLWNITNFVMLFHAMMEFCLDLLRSKFWLIEVRSDPIRLRNNFINPIRSEMNILIPKSERIRSDRICTPLMETKQKSLLYVFV